MLARSIIFKFSCGLWGGELWEGKHMGGNSMKGQGSFSEVALCRLTSDTLADPQQVA